MTVKIYDAAIALMQAGFNVQFTEPTFESMGLLAIKNGRELNFDDSSDLKFNSCDELVRYCESKAETVEAKEFSIRNNMSLFTFF